MSVPCAHCCLDPPVMLRGVHCPGVDHIHYAKIPFFVLLHHRSGGASNPSPCVKCQHLGRWLVVGRGGRKTVKMKMVWLINCKHCLKDQHVYLISCLVTNGVWCECYQPAAWARDGPFLFLSAASMHTLGVACPCAQKGCSTTSQKLRGSKGPPHFGSAIPAPPPDNSERRLSLLAGSDLFSGESNDKKNYPDLPSPPPTFFLYEVIYTLGIERRHCCCSRSVTDTSVTINGIYLP